MKWPDSHMKQESGQTINNHPEVWGTNWSDTRGWLIQTMECGDDHRNEALFSKETNLYRNRCSNTRRKIVKVFLVPNRSPNNRHLPEQNLLLSLVGTSTNLLSPRGEEIKLNNSKSTPICSLICQIHNKVVFSHQSWIQRRSIFFNCVTIHFFS